MRGVLTAVLGLFAAASVATVVVQELARDPAARAVGPAAYAGDVLVATYFHGNRRCSTCNTIEAWAHEALRSAFPAEWRSGRIAWRTRNYEEDANAGFRERYGLYSSTLVLSDVRGGEERDWYGLDEVWMLVGDREAFCAYVVREARAALEAVP